MNSRHKVALRPDNAVYWLARSAANRAHRKGFRRGFWHTVKAFRGILDQI